MTVPGGVRINQIWSYRTALPLSVAVPFLDSFSSANSIFTTDLNGDGLTGDILPGTNVRAGPQHQELQPAQSADHCLQSELPESCPAGQALIAAYLSPGSIDQNWGYRETDSTGSVDNPWPFQNLFNRTRISR
jgi:hypothetical protein